MLSIAILDDNIKLLEEYEQIIPAWFSKNNINGRIVVSTTDYRAFLREVRDRTANTLIMDINLRSEVNGLYIAKLLRKEEIPVEIIFCTGLLEYMPQAFDVNAYNYIVKPVGRNLEKCLIKLNSEINARESGKKALEIKLGTRIYYIPIDSISHMRREGSKTVINATNRILEVYDSLDSLESRLNDERFFKCHRATIVNRDYIDYIDKRKRRLVLTTGGECVLGTKFLTQSFIMNRSDEYAI